MCCRASTAWPRFLPFARKFVPRTNRQGKGTVEDPFSDRSHSPTLAAEDRANLPYLFGRFPLRHSVRGRPPFDVRRPRCSHGGGTVPVYLSSKRNVSASDRIARHQERSSTSPPKNRRRYRSEKHFLRGLEGEDGPNTHHARCTAAWTVLLRTCAKKHPDIVHWTRMRTCCTFWRNQGCEMHSWRRRG